MDFLTFVRLQWDRVGAWVAIGLGAIVLLIGWLGVSNTVYPAEQLPYIISAGIVGACLIGIGAMLWLSADLRDEWTELREIATLLGDQHETAAATDADANGSSNGSGDGERPKRPSRVTRTKA
jgi:hypothetical protein